MQKIESFSDASYHLAQIKIARILAPIDDVIMAEFVAQLPPINALSECSVHEFSRIYAKDVKHS